MIPIAPAAFPTVNAVLTPRPAPSAALVFVAALFLGGAA
jgi:hypothetical protein